MSAFCLAIASLSHASSGPLSLSGTDEISSIALDKLPLDIELSALKRMKAGSAAPIEEPGKNIPEEIAAQQCIYDMILVERVSMPESTGSTIF